MYRLANYSMRTVLMKNLIVKVGRKTIRGAKRVERIYYHDFVPKKSWIGTPV